MGKAVPTSATPMAPAIRYVLLSDDSSPTADTATTLEAAGLLPHQGKAGRREGATAAAGGGREEEEEESGLRDAMGCPASEGVRGESREQRVASAKRDRTIANDDELDDVTAGVGDNEGRRGRHGVEIGGVGPSNKG
ncbi:hypothetical protein BHE74_00003479 [Ensete ventricosum]|nr:hypothetical protein BHE74_00003479 [Ensete ventricosum]RZR82219.1 hypothetical protein BHM03_00008600 [Ensete ventricosum]